MKPYVLTDEEIKILERLHEFNRQKMSTPEYREARDKYLERQIEELEKRIKGGKA